MSETRPGIGAGLQGVLTSAVRDGGRLIATLSGGLLRFIEAFLFDSMKARYGASVTRMLLALVIIGTLLTNWSTRYYTFGRGGAWSGDLATPGSDFPKIWLFSAFQSVRTNDSAFTALYLILIGLAVLMLIGYRTRATMILVLIGWVSFIELQDMVGDQSDNITRIALIALLFADTASVWSIDAKRRRSAEARRGHPVVRWWSGGLILPDWLRNMSHNLVLVVLTAQVSFVYVSGAFYKAQGTSWAGGYGVYAPVTVEQFGPWPELSAIITAWGPGVAAATYLTILAQAFFPALLLTKWTRRMALIIIGGFHLGIAIFMGLPFFSLSMIAIDAIFIRDATWSSFGPWFRRAWNSQQEPSAAVSAGRDGDPAAAVAEPGTDAADGPLFPELPSQAEQSRL